MENKYILSLYNTFNFEDNIVINNIEFKNKNKKTIKIPLIIFYKNHIYIIKVIQGNLFKNKETLNKLENELIDFQTQFNISENMYSVFCYYFNKEDNHNELYFYNHTFEKALRIASIENYIKEDKKHIGNVRFEEILNNILFSSNIQEKAKYDLSEILYVKKHNRWFKCNSKDSEKLFYTTAFFGCFGFHKLKSKKCILYFLSCGLFGIGTIFDTLQLLLTMKKDNEGLYFPPLTDISKKWIIFLCSIFFTIFLLFIYVFLLSNIASLFSSFGISIIESKIDNNVIQNIF